MAERLQKAGACPGLLFGILSERSEEYVLAILAVQACGGAFLPLDPSFPDSRLADMVADAKVHALLVSDAIEGLAEHAADPFFRSFDVVPAGYSRRVAHGNSSLVSSRSIGK